jgi:hypothetical protein
VQMPCRQACLLLAALAQRVAAGHVGPSLPDLVQSGGRPAGALLAERG